MPVPPRVRANYLSKLSGPLMDRVDLRVVTRPMTRGDLRDDFGQLESSAVVRERVLAARERMAKRFAGTPWRLNGEVPGPELRAGWRLSADTTREADQEFDQGKLTGRGYDRVLRVAWTIADLAGRGEPDEQDVQRGQRLPATGAGGMTGAQDRRAWAAAGPARQSRRSLDPERRRQVRAAGGGASGSCRTGRGVGGGGRRSRPDRGARRAPGMPRGLASGLRVWTTSAVAAAGTIRAGRSLCGCSVPPIWLR